MSRDYIIAEHRIRIEGEKLLRAVDTIEGFRPFLANSSEPPLVTVTSEDTEDMLVPPFQKEEYSFVFEKIHSIFGRTSNGYLFKATPNDGDPQCLWGEKDGKVIYIKGRLEGDSQTTRLVRFALWIAFGMSTARLDTIAIHTSTITYQGRNVLFLGESGTGKSTHTRLWRQNIPGATLLNDDSPILRIVDGEPWIYGSPWSGKTHCYKNERHPLAACVRLAQAPYNKIHKLRTVQAYAAIHPSCPPEFAYDEYLYDGISRTLDAVLSQVPFYYLECLPNAEAAKLSCKTIFGE